MIEINPASVEARFGRAAANQHLGKWQEAALDYNEILKVNPKNTEARKGRDEALARAEESGQVVAGEQPG